MNHPEKGVLFTRSSTIALAGSTLLFIAALALMGRIAWCTCGFGLWTMHAWASDTSQLFLDPYSFSHILHGVFFYALLLLVFRKVPLHQRLLLAVFMEFGWEILENSPLIINRYRTATAALDYTGDSILNSVGDVCSVILGFWFTARFSWKWTVALVIVIELVMLYFIRDNLTLNVLMLLYPIDAIRDWQTAI